MARMKIVEVEWVDSSSEGGWKPREIILEKIKKDTLVCRTAGYLLDEKEDRITIALSYAPDLDQFNHTQTIPAVAIKSMKVRR